MASTLTNLLYHVVWSTKGRVPLITDDIKEPLYKYIGGIIRNQDGKAIEIGGMPDHVHCLARFPARKAVSDILRAIKSDSAGWVNRERPGDRFAGDVPLAVETRERRLQVSSFYAIAFTLSSSRRR